MSASFSIRHDANATEIVRIEADGTVLMRAENGKLVPVLLTEREIAKLRKCSDLIDGLKVLAAIIARALRPN